jgi:hypothetical protein
MTSAAFFKRLLFLTLLVGVSLILLHQSAAAARPHAAFAAATVILFVAICIGIFYAGLSALRSTNRYAFNNLVSVSVFGKMVAAIAFLFVYQRLLHPPNQWFVGIFLLCYVTYTIFEVWFMTRLAKSK